jgi:hypothetical protein
VQYAMDLKGYKSNNTNNPTEDEEEERSVNNLGTVKS